MKKYWVYIHTCPNGKKYVGITTRSEPERRWAKGKGYKHNEHFYRAILKYGWDNFEHEVFEVDSAEEMYRKEVELISFYHSNDPEYGYNHSTGGECIASGCKHSEESKKKVSEILKGRTFSEEAREKLRNASFHKDPEYKRKLCAANKKKWLDPEFRKKMSEVRKGKVFSEEHKRHIAEARKGKHHSEEARKHMAEAAKKRAKDPEYLKKLSKAHKGKPKPKVKIKLPDGTIVEMPKNLIARNYINKGKEFEYVS